MENRQIVFTEPGKVQLQSEPIDLRKVDQDQVLIKTEFSVASPGTELAILSGKEFWAPLPFVPGYGSIGRVVAAGSAVTAVKEGDRVFTYGKHAEYSFDDIMTLPVAEDCNGVEGVFARIAAISITSLRASQAELGDYVAVIGMGIVGNLAAQLFTKAGCEVIGIDTSESRLRTAAACGIAHTVTAGPDAQKKISEITGGKMCVSVVDATGIAAVMEQAADYAGKLGEVILLGSPRGTHQTDIVPFLDKIHHIKYGTVTFKGALEWRYPRTGDADGFIKHSITSNAETVLRMITKKQLIIEPMLTHTVSPAQSPEIYEGFQTKKDDYLGVVFDWSQLQ